jgi:hypothetical protein
MARKNTVVYQLAKAQSLAASFSTTPTIVRYLDNCSYQINVTTSDSTGTFQVEVSNDYYVNEGNDSVVMNPGSWTALTLAGGTPFVAAADDTIVINLNQLPFYAVRIHYTSTVAGTGTCDIFVTDKQIGG